jgi:UDP-glucose:(heptosyl)LPS alpha-1,3-glucosyltransferase
MRIALVILHADPNRGGAEKYTHDLARSLAAQGQDVFTRASSFHGDSSANPVLLRAKANTRLGQYRRFLDALDEHLQSIPYDIVHAMLPVRQCDIYHPHAGLAAGRREKNWINRLNAKRRYFATVERQLLQRKPLQGKPPQGKLPQGKLPQAKTPPIVLCLSQYVKTAVQQVYSLEDSSLATVLNGVDLQTFSPGQNAALRRDLSIDPAQTVALMIAQDFARKGLRQAILALSDVPQMTLVVVGKESVHRYRSLARRAGILPRVRFVGTTTDPVAFYRMADCFVLPTRHDPCSLAVLEALACGLPVVSTRFNGACEVMQDGIHGFVLDDPQDVPALAQRLRQITDHSTRQKMRDACVALRPSLSQDEHVRKVLDVYRRRLLIPSG